MESTSEINERKIYEELFYIPKETFKEHLMMPENNRIIFSGKFGVGKTTFIKQFFNNDNKYNPYFLYPVNYTVATNEDIFKYIKYDIIIEMMKRGDPIEVGEDFSLWWTLHAEFTKLLPLAASEYISAIHNLGKDVSVATVVLGAWEAISNKFKSLKDKNEAINATAFESSVVMNYVDSFKKKDGSLKEFGIESKLIQNVLKRIKPSVEENNLKENILIIDDLDRIDPEHIFRLLNVFAAHFDYDLSPYDNKFGFDKIIFICDIENIRKIFQNKYGMDVDFDGYIDKFYSHSIYEYWNIDDLKNLIRHSIRRENWDGVASARSIDFDSVMNLQFLTDVITSLVSNRQITLRNLVRVMDTKLMYKSTDWFDGRKIETKNFPILQQLKTLSQIAGNKVSLIGMINRIGDKLLAGNGKIANYVRKLVILLLSDKTDNELKTGVRLVFKTEWYEFKFSKDDHFELQSIRVFSADQNAELFMDSSTLKKLVIICIELL